jgi:Icc-related predicted phosphoesterase
LGLHSHKFKHIVVVPGNHEFYPDAISLLLTNVTHYLRDTCVTLEGIKIYGSRFKPYWRWLPYGRPCDAKTNYDDVKDENDIDVIITHVAPYFKHASRMFRCGSELITELTLVKKPRVHIFGHDHHAYGALQIDKTTFIAAASVSGHNKTLNKPILFSIAK